MSSTNQEPYLTLGNHLRFLREQHRESLAEVSGAVEIDENALASIEAGKVRPEEEILMLLISHYNMQDQEAVQLWELAGYENNTNSRAEDLLQDSMAQGKQVVVLFGLDARTMYTDTVQIDTSSAGISMKFGQLNSQDQAQHVAKVGMSYEQAEAVLRQLQAAILYGRHNQEPKQLPPSARD